MSRSSRRFVHPTTEVAVSLRLYGKRVMLRPITAQDFEAWSEVRKRNGDWLRVWEPRMSIISPDPAESRDAFVSRCSARDRERAAGTNFSFGLFVNGMCVGEVNLNNVLRGAVQCATIGYWIDKARAGNGYVAEAVVALTRFAFDELRLHRLEICIIPRNTNSRRVMQKLNFREEGTAERFLEINGVWEDHVRYGFTVEEWTQRAEELSAAWL
jgi:ribosomal-protein-alanine N-acetyltransferase